MALHKIQQLVLKIAEEKDISNMSLKEIGQEAEKMDPEVGRTYPQIIKFHMDQLKKKGLLNIDRSKGVITRNVPGWAKDILENKENRIFNIPVYGTANCGPGGIVAEQNLEGFVSVSSALLEKKPEDSFFAVIADGKSMNKTSLKGKNIESGDDLIVDKTAPRGDGDIAVAILENRGLIKKVIKDKEHHELLLVSESTEQYPPIVLHENDSFILNGKVIRVIKNK